MRAYLLAAQWLALVSIYGVCLYLSWLMWLDHWSRDFHGKVAFWLLIGFGFFLVRETLRIGDTANDWWWGGEMEREVARRLDPLRDEGWMVVHDIPREGGGNVDHFVSGRGGVFAIETKRGRNRAASRNQAVSGAVWVREKFGERRWVTGLLCVGTDPPARPIKQGHVWVWARTISRHSCASRRTSPSLQRRANPGGGHAPAVEPSPSRCSAKCPKCGQPRRGAVRQSSSRPTP